MTSNISRQEQTEIIAPLKPLSKEAIDKELERSRESLAEVDACLAALSTAIRTTQESKDK